MTWLHRVARRGAAQAPSLPRNHRRHYLLYEDTKAERVSWAALIEEYFDIIRHVRVMTVDGRFLADMEARVRA